MKIDLEQLYETRLLVFLETAPQSNEYHHVHLSPEEFKKVSFAIGKVVDKEGDNETVETQMSTETYKLPDLPSIVE